jgi:hypothetical protein
MWIRWIRIRNTGVYCAGCEPLQQPGEQGAGGPAGQSHLSHAKLQQLDQVCPHSGVHHQAEGSRVRRSAPIPHCYGPW